MNSGIIKIKTRECKENGEVIQEKTIKVFGIPVYNKKQTSTNNQVMAAFTPPGEQPNTGNNEHKVVGFGK